MIVLCAVVFIVAVGSGIAEDGCQECQDYENDECNQATFFPLLFFVIVGLLVGVAHWAVALLVGNLGLQPLVQLVDGILLVGAFVADGALTAGFVFIDHKVAVAVPIDAEGLRLSDVLPDEEPCDLLGRQMVGGVPCL